jgi:tRNA-Thr(GGU) m(6)t(6)A37 methyltransferase TsaA
MDQTKTDLPLEYTFRPIGVIHTPFKEKAETPIQSSRSSACGEVEVFPEFDGGLESLDALSNIILIYVFHQAPSDFALMVKPFLDESQHGIFSTRYPVRPNPIGISVVRLLQVQGNRLMIAGVDMLDQTPLLDIKPYLPDFDVHPVEKVGWYGRRAHP